MAGDGGAGGAAGCGVEGLTLNPIAAGRHRGAVMAEDGGAGRMWS